MNNYESIKKMSIEEMAKYNTRLISTKHNGAYKFCYSTSDNNSYAERQVAINHELDWLNMETNHVKSGKELIGKKIEQGTRFKVINIEPHKNCDFPIICLNEYIGKIGCFNSSFVFLGSGIYNEFMSSATFEKEYMNAIDKENGKLCWKWDEVELID